MPLTKQQTKELGELLEERRAALLAELRDDAARVREQPYAEHAGATHDIGDESVAALLADLEEADLSRDLGEFRALEVARGRLKSGAYGVCLDCGSDVGYERLKAFPAALRCVRCQDRHEKTYGGASTPRL